MPAPSGPRDVIERLMPAINQHELEALAGCFAPDYASEFPTHPARAFHAQAQMRQNRMQIFGGVPDIAAELLRSGVDGDTVGAEWEWRGTWRDGDAFLMRGVTIGIHQNRIAWARLHMEPVQVGSGSDAAVRQTVSGQTTE